MVVDFTGPPLPKRTPLSGKKTFVPENDLPSEAPRGAIGEDAVQQGERSPAVDGGSGQSVASGAVVDCCTCGAHNAKANEGCHSSLRDITTAAAGAGKYSSPLVKQNGNSREQMGD